MTQYYECHVTMLGNKEVLKRITENIGWVFSSIENDANLGEGVKMYATKQLNKRVQDRGAVQILQDAAQLLRDWGADVLREKVEVVIFDTRSSKVRACTDCASCQEAREC